MDAQTIALAVIGLFQLILIPIGQYFFSRIRANEIEIQNFKLEVTKEYVTKDDMKEHVSTHLANIEEQINSLKTLITESLGKSK